MSDTYLYRTHPSPEHIDVYFRTSRQFGHSKLMQGKDFLPIFPVNINNRHINIKHIYNQREKKQATILFRFECVTESGISTNFLSFLTSMSKKMTNMGVGCGYFKKNKEYKQHRQAIPTFTWVLGKADVRRVS